MELRLVLFSLVVTRGYIWDPDKHHFLENSYDYLKTHVLLCIRVFRQMQMTHQRSLGNDPKHPRIFDRFLNSELLDPKI